VHCASGSRDFTPTHPQDDQFYRCVDVRNSSKPVEVGRWWMPGTRQGDNVIPPSCHPIDKGFRAHNTNVYPQHSDRCYLADIDGGMLVLHSRQDHPCAPLSRLAGSGAKLDAYLGF